MLKIQNNPYKIGYKFTIFFQLFLILQSQIYIPLEKGAFVHTGRLGGIAGFRGSPKGHFVRL